MRLSHRLAVPPRARPVVRTSPGGPTASQSRRRPLMSISAVPVGSWSPPGPASHRQRPVEKRMLWSPPRTSHHRCCPRVGTHAVHGPRSCSRSRCADACASSAESVEVAGCQPAAAAPQKSLAVRASGMDSPSVAMMLTRSYDVHLSLSVVLTLFDCAHFWNSPSPPFDLRTAD